MQKHLLPTLEYNLNSFEPKISAETMDCHYNKHLKAYLDNLNKLIEGTPYVNYDLDHIVREADGAIFNNAGQAINHTMYFDNITPDQTVLEPSGKLLEAIEISFGSFGSMKEQFAHEAIKFFGSGWAFIVMNGKELNIVTLPNGETPLKVKKQPILVLDLWEHAYYLDHQNRRVDYVRTFWELVDWDKVQKRYESNI